MQPRSTFRTYACSLKSSLLNPIVYNLQHPLGKPSSHTAYSTDGVLGHASPTIGTLERFVPTILRPGILRLFRCLLLTGHRGKRGMLDTMRINLYWPHMANDLYKAV